MMYMHAVLQHEHGASAWQRSMHACSPDMHAAPGVKAESVVDLVALHGGMLVMMAADVEGSTCWTQ